MVDRIVALTESSMKPGRMRKVASVRRTAAASLIIGCLLILLSAAALSLIIMTWSQPELLVGVAFLGVVGGLMVWSGRNRLHVNRLRNPRDDVNSVAPHAFRITDDTLEFPGSLAQAAQSWSRASTTATVESCLGQPALKLAHPDRVPRRYFAKVLKETPETVLRAVEHRH